MPPSTRVQVHKPRIMKVMDAMSRDWAVVQRAKSLLAGGLTPSEFVHQAEQAGYRLENPRVDREHLANDWADENGQGWFGPVFPQILEAFKDALDRVADGGPFLDVWWVHGGLPQGSDPKLEYWIQPYRDAGVKMLGLFIVTTRIRHEDWESRYPGGEEDEITLLQTK